MFEPYFVALVRIVSIFFGEGIQVFLGEGLRLSVIVDMLVERVVAGLVVGNDYFYIVVG